MITLYHGSNVGIETINLDRYTRHMITLPTLVEELTYRRLNRQYFFGTLRAIQPPKRL